MKILVVDDELVSRKMMQKIMDAFGECTVVESGRAALAAFKKTAENQETFDLITLDVSMSDMDGIEVLREIRKKENRDPKERRVRIMMVTSHMDKDTIVGCIKAGCDDYIVKPFDNETIYNKLENLGVVEVDVQPTPLATKELIVEEIASRFKRGEIDLPPLPETTSKLREMIRQGASLQKVTELLIQDAAICSKRTLPPEIGPFSAANPRGY